MSLSGKILNDIGDFGEYSNPREPDIFTYFGVIGADRKTKPGPDQLPYSAYKNKHMAESLLSIDNSLRNGDEPPNNFNVSSCHFLPKGDKEGDDVQVVREPLATRPLSMKNCDNKHIMSANIRVLEPQYNIITNKAQNVFVSGRHFLTNVVDIDAAGRICPTCIMVALRPCVIVLRTCL